MDRSLYWAYVSFTDQPGGKTRPVLLLRQTEDSYVILRLTSKYQTKSKFMQSKYVEVKDWQASHLPKRSWIDTYRTYSLPIASTKLNFIGLLSVADLLALSQHFQLD